MNSFKKISLFFILACISQLTCTEITQASIGNGQQSTKRSRKAAHKNNKNSHHNKKVAATQRYQNNQPQMNNPGAAVAGGAAVKNNNEQQDKIDNLWAAWNTYCINNPSDTRCNNNTNYMPATA
jgi:hypothetical protein